jgi:hypothetical protein
MDKGTGMTSKWSFFKYSSRMYTGNSIPSKESMLYTMYTGSSIHSKIFIATPSWYTISCVCIPVALNKLINEYMCTTSCVYSRVVGLYKI